MVNRLTVTLEQPEYSALLQLAVRDLRDPQDQLRYILRQVLLANGMLPDEYRPATIPTETTTEASIAAR